MGVAREVVEVGGAGEKRWCFVWSGGSWQRKGQFPGGREWCGRRVWGGGEVVVWAGGGGVWCWVYGVTYEVRSYGGLKLSGCWGERGVRYRRLSDHSGMTCNGGSGDWPAACERLWGRVGE